MPQYVLQMIKRTDTHSKNNAKEPETSLFVDWILSRKEYHILHDHRS